LRDGCKKYPNGSTAFDESATAESARFSARNCSDAAYWGMHVAVFCAAKVSCQRSWKPQTCGDIPPSAYSFRSPGACGQFSDLRNWVVSDLGLFSGWSGHGFVYAAAVQTLMYLGLGLLDSPVQDIFAPKKHNCCRFNNISRLIPRADSMISIQR
jgi:hypothetical protein